MLLGGDLDVAPSIGFLLYRSDQEQMKPSSIAAWFCW
jgi:hypothetical protein